MDRRDGDSTDVADGDAVTHVNSNDIAEPSGCQSAHRDREFIRPAFDPSVGAWAGIAADAR